MRNLASVYSKIDLYFMVFKNTHVETNELVSHYKNDGLVPYQEFSGFEYSDEFVVSIVDFGYEGIQSRLCLRIINCFRSFF